MRAIVLAILLAGCASSASHVHVAAGGAAGSVSVHTDVAGALAIAATMALVAYTLYGIDSETGFLGPDSRFVPELDPSRRVSEQDCTKPIDFTRGNIRCK